MQIIFKFTQFKTAMLDWTLQVLTIFYFKNTKQVYIDEALPWVLENRGNRAFISGGIGNKGKILRGTKTIFGNREHKKTNFRFLGKRGTSQFISGEQGNRYPPRRAFLIYQLPPILTVLLHVA